MGRFHLWDPAIAIDQLSNLLLLLLLLLVFPHPQDMIYYHALHMMLGGGASFSAGGPGKGLYSRLYSDVLNSYPWVQTATAFAVQYEDSGFFGILGETDSMNVKNLASVLAQQFERVASSPAQDKELARVKKMLKSSMLMNLESRDIITEDIGRQILATGKRIPPAELCRQVDAMTAADLQRVARSMLNTPLTLAAYGDTQATPKFDAVQQHFGSIAKQLPQ